MSLSEVKKRNIIAVSRNTQPTPEKQPRIMDDRIDKKSSIVCVFQVGGDDCKLTVKEDKDFLAAKSCVFETMFNGSLPEGDSVNIPDVKPSTFMFMLSYLHEDPCCLWSKEMAIDVMHVAEKYALLELKEKCEEFLLPKTIEEVWFVADCAFRYNSAKLLNAVRDLLSNYTWEFIFDKNFVKISEDLVLEVVQLESVTKVTELEIFDQVLEWAKYQLKEEGLDFKDQKLLHQKLEKCLKHIRFLIMSPKDFSSGPAKSGVLSSEEVQNISEYFSSAQKECSPVLTVCMNTKPRKGISEPAQKTIYPTMQVAMCSPEDTVLSFSDSILREQVKLVKRAHVLTVIVPSQKVTSDTSCSYYQEDLQVSVDIVLSVGTFYTGGFLHNGPNKCGSGVFKGAVQYGQQIHIPIVPYYKYSNLSSQVTTEASPLIYTVEIKFKRKGVYPWHSSRKFDDCDLFGQQDQSSGLIIGYKFMPF